MSDRKTALITGSTSGIGLGVAEALAASGMNIVLNGFGDADEIEANRSRIAEQNGVDVIHSGADMTSPDEISDMMAAAADRFGRIDVLVNNAGIQFVSEIEAFPPDRWDAIIAINLSSSFHTIRAALPAMKTGGWGRIVNIVSAHGLVASPNKSAYVAAKHGMMGLTKTVALECATNGVTVNAVCPGYVWTPLVEKQIPDQARTRGVSEDEVKDILLASQPTREFATVDQIGALVLFLCSDAAASITGTHVSVDGGWTAQ